MNGSASSGDAVEWEIGIHPTDDPLDYETYTVTAVDRDEAEQLAKEKAESDAVENPFVYSASRADQ